MSCSGGCSRGYSHSVSLEKPSYMPDPNLYQSSGCGQKDYIREWKADRSMYQ